MSVLAVISVIALLIFVHELGHFLAARFQGIHVNRFSIGFGPILWKFQGSRTEYALRALPLGGFVGFPMEEDSDTSFAPDDPNLLQNRPVMDRAIVGHGGCRIAVRQRGWLPRRGAPRHGWPTAIHRSLLQSGCQTHGQCGNGY